MLVASGCRTVVVGKEALGALSQVLEGGPDPLTIIMPLVAQAGDLATAFGRHRIVTAGELAQGPDWAGPPQVVPEAFSLTYQALERTMRTITLLVTGNLSPKELGGPVLIYQVTTQAARAGYSWLLNITAFISVNLCVFNLLPLPVLDGSLLVYIVLEGIRRKPIDIRALERIQQAGVVLIIGLLLYVTFNDISRVLTNLVP